MKTVVGVKTDARDQQIRRAGDEPAARIFERRAAVHDRHRAQDVLHRPLQFESWIDDQNVLDRAALHQCLDDPGRTGVQARRLGQDRRARGAGVETGTGESTQSLRFIALSSSPQPGAQRPTYLGLSVYIEGAGGGKDIGLSKTVKQR